MYTLTLLPRNPFAAYGSRTFMETSRYPVVEVALNIRSCEDTNVKDHNAFPAPSKPGLSMLFLRGGALWG